MEAAIAEKIREDEARKLKWKQAACDVEARGGRVVQHTLAGGQVLA